MNQHCSSIAVKVLNPDQFAWKPKRLGGCGKEMKFVVYSTLCVCVSTFLECCFCPMRFGIVAVRRKCNNGKRLRTRKERYRYVEWELVREGGGDIGAPLLWRVA